MTMQIDVILSPAEFPALAARDLGETTCVVFDVLRATSSMLTALNNGAEAIIPVSEIAEALAIKQQRSDVLLAGERNGLRIRADATGGIDFDFGNSPRDFTPDKVKEKTIAWTTTNGTRALRSCAHAKMILLGAFVNLGALAKLLDILRPKKLLLVCGGTHEEVAYEDALAAGALIEELAPLITTKEGLGDAARLAWNAWRAIGEDTGQIAATALNARRLKDKSGLAEDVNLCLRRDAIQQNAALMDNGSIRLFRGASPLLA
jgi:2-phosphosulfolactate phosphatase